MQWCLSKRFIKCNPPEFKIYPPFRPFDLIKKWICPVFLKPFCPYGWISQSQILSFWSFAGRFSMCFCDKLSTTSTRLSQLIFTREKSRRLDFNKAFNLVTLYISNIYTIKVFSLERRDRTQKQRLITSRIFSSKFFALWNLFRKIGNYLFAKNWKNSWLLITLVLRKI